MLTTFAIFFNEVMTNLYMSLNTYDYTIDNEGFNEWMYQTAKSWLKGEYQDIQEIQSELDELYKQDQQNKE